MIQALSGTWRVAEASCADVLAADRAAAEWLPAEVPGCVHLDLIRAGRIPDPFYGTNDLDVQWVADRDWLYCLDFDCSAELLDRQRVELVCEGLDTFATVALNGRVIGRAQNMFREWRWDLTGLLKATGNRLLLLFESPKRRADEMAAADDTHLSTLFGAHRVYARKAQYASGWDWGPDLNTSGIWLPIYLEGTDGLRIADVWARTEWADDGAATVHAEVTLEAAAECEVTIRAELAGLGPAVRAQTTARLEAGTQTVAVPVRVQEPKLWWPAGMGPQEIYDLRITVKGAGESLTASRRVGLRRVELVREADEEGESFVFRVNGEPVFCRGADWIPSDNFIPRLRPADYDHLLQMAADAHMNMLRVWGGGIYERREFYEACDRLGIMLWQDFMFACAVYPEHLAEFREEVQREAEGVIRRLRNHPSIVLWCGNNECQMIYPGEHKGEHEGLYTEVLPRVCAALDPTRPYWPSSPYGGPDVNCQTHGDQHNWDCWWGSKGAQSMRRYNGRFLSEFGFQAPPALETIGRYIPAAEQYVQSRTMEHHNRAWEGTQRLYHHLAAMFRVPCGFEDTVYVMQLLQAEIVKLAVEYWRSRKFRTAGALYWQFNDCWPAVSWSAVDYAHLPKALYHYSRRFFAPVLPLPDLRDGRFQIAVVNDERAPFDGELLVGLGSVAGAQLWSERMAAHVDANGVATVFERAEADLGVSDRASEYVWCRLLRDGRELAVNTWFFAPPKHVQFPVPDWETAVRTPEPGRHVVRLCSPVFAKGVWLRAPGVEAEFRDNYFDVLPGTAVEVEALTAPDVSAQELERRLQVRTLADTLGGDPSR